MGPAAVTHHHRSTSKASHKPFKSRFATKGALRDLAKGKIQKSQGRGHKSRQQRVMSKLDRKNQARQKQQLKQQQHAQSTKVFAGQNGAPRIVAVVPLSQDIDASTAIRNLNAAIDLDVAISSSRPTSVRIERFEQSVQYVPCSRDLFKTLDSCRAADYVLFVTSALQEVDEASEILLRAIESQGVSSVVTVASGLEGMKTSKRRQDILSSLRSYISHFFPEQNKVYALDALQECSNIIRSLCSSVPNGIRWREDRGWLLVEDVAWEDDHQGGSCSFSMTGFVRGAGLSANSLLQVGDLGAFQIEKIVAAPSSSTRKRKANEMAVDEADEAEVLGKPDLNHEDLLEVAPEEINVQDDNLSIIHGRSSGRKGVLLDDDYECSDEERPDAIQAHKVPRGTSAYQAAWYLDGMSDSGSDWEDQEEPSGTIDMESEVMEDIGNGMLEDPPPAETAQGAPSEYPQSEMFLDPAPQDEAGEIAAYRSNRNQKANEDLEFPDEVELHPNVLARERLVRYRGLKSFKTSPWVTGPDRPYEPDEWNRLLQVPNYSGAKRKAFKKPAENAVQAGRRVKVYLKDVPTSFKTSMDLNAPMFAFFLHRHEQKRTVMNFSITLDSEFEGSIKSKDELLMQCGPRRFVVNPIFSVPGVTNNDVHKYERYLHPGRTAVATVIAPLTWGATPTLFFQRSPPSGDTSNNDSESAPTKLIATGTVMPPSSTRVVAKRVVLTGHPFKIHKRLVTVRYMFFNAEDVRWFRALRLWTRRGRSGFVKESLGTHGYFKATFDGRINPQDAVAVSLYKRMWPRTVRPWRAEEASEDRVREVDMADSMYQVVGRCKDFR